jgi:hypothetical protein
MGSKRSITTPLNWSRGSGQVVVEPPIAFSRANRFRGAVVAIEVCELGGKLVTMSVGRKVSAGVGKATAPLLGLIDEAIV